MRKLECEKVQEVLSFPPFPDTFGIETTVFDPILACRPGPCNDNDDNAFEGGK